MWYPVYYRSEWRHISFKKNHISLSSMINNVRDVVLAHLSRRLKWAFLIKICPLSVVIDVVFVVVVVGVFVCVVVVNFSHVHLLLQNHWTKFQPNLAQSIVGWRGFKFSILMKFSSLNQHFDIGICVYWFELFSQVSDVDHGPLVLYSVFFLKKAKSHQLTALLQVLLSEIDKCYYRMQLSMLYWCSARFYNFCMAPKGSSS